MIDRESYWSPLSAVHAVADLLEAEVVEEAESDASCFLVPSGQVDQGEHL